MENVTWFVGLIVYGGLILAGIKLGVENQKRTRQLQGFHLTLQNHHMTLQKLLVEHLKSHNS